MMSGAGNYVLPTLNQDHLGNQVYPALDRATIIEKDNWDERHRSFLGDVVSIDDADSPYTIDRERSVILVDCTAGAVTVNLPPASERIQMSFTITKTAGSATNPISVTPDGTDTIKGSTGPMLILLANSSANVYADGVSAWRLG